MADARQEHVNAKTGTHRHSSTGSTGLRQDVEGILRAVRQGTVRSAFPSPGSTSVLGDVDMGLSHPLHCKSINPLPRTVALLSRP